MPNYVCFLIVVLYRGYLVRCALRVPKHTLTGDCEENPMEPENTAQLHALLPAHVQSMGPIVDVDEIFEIAVVN